MRKGLLRFTICFTLIMICALQRSTAQNWGLTGNADATNTSVLGTTNAIPLRLHTNNLPRLVIDTGGRVGIGTATPMNLFSVVGTGSAPAASWVGSNTLLSALAENATGNGDFVHGMASDVVTARPALIGRRSRGTLALPTPVVSNDNISSWISSAYDGAGFQSSAAMDFSVDGTVAAGSVPGRITFSTGTNAANRTERFRIGSSGYIYFNSTQLTLNAGTGDVSVGKGNITFATANQTLLFPAVSGTVKPMITMFGAVNANTSRMVIAPSLTNPNYGLKYSQTNDSIASWEFVSAKGTALKIDPYTRTVTTGDSLIGLAVNAGPVFIGRRAKGALTLPTAVKANDNLTSVYGAGFDGTAYQTAAGMEATADSDATAGSAPTRLSFVTGSNAANRTERMRIGSTGNVSFNNTQLTLTQATGDVNVGQGNLLFSNSNQCIQFGSLLANPKAMMAMMPNATAANSRMVFVPTPASVSTGLKYNHVNDSTGSFDFIGKTGSALKVDLYSKTVTMGNVSMGDSIALSQASTVATARPVVFGRRARGTAAVPAVVALNDNMASYVAAGYDGANYQSSAAMDFMVDGAVTANNVPGRISFYTGNNAATRTERLKIGSSGNIFFNSSQLSLTASTGDVAVGKGNITFATANQTLLFPAVSGTVKPMITMFATANANTNRMVIAPSPTNQNYGLKYTQLNDSAATWEIVGSRGTVLKVEPMKKLVTISDSLISGRVNAFYTGPSTTINGANFGQGAGVYGYSAGVGSYGSQGVYGRAADLGAGVHGESINGSGTDGYSINGVGNGGTSHNGFGVYGYSETGSNYAGYFDGEVFGDVFYSSSDRKLKKNITDITSGMDIISRLKPRTYEFRHDGTYNLMHLPQGQRYGLVAQELEEVLPNLVKQNTFDSRLATHKEGEKIDFKAVNYTELIPIMIKGMQEQNSVIEEQKVKLETKDKEIQDIKSELEELKNMLIAKGILQEKEAAKTNVKLSNQTLLEQNVPNPPVNNATQISYNVPASGKAEIVFTDMSGKVVKQVPVKGTGKGVLNIDTTTLAAGTYSYTLYVDGKVIESKKMIVGTK